MSTERLLVIAVLAALSGCASYTLPVPSDFTAANALPVAGASGFRQKDMTVGEYHVAINRGSTSHRDEGTDIVRDARKRQSYNFVMRRGDALVFTGGCMLAANETSVAAPAGIRISASDKAELDCELLPNGTGRESWKLRLNGETDRPLNGEFTGGGQTYSLEGVGTAIGSTKHGPTGGYHIKQNGRMVASVQTTGKRQVVFAPDAQSDALVAAAVVLLLIDESVRELGE